MLKSLSSFIAGPAGVFLVLFFFLPWITISCAEGLEFDEDVSGFPSLKVEASGLDLATGNAKDDLERQVLSLSGGFDTGVDDFNFDNTDGVTTTSPSSSGGFDTEEEDTALDADPLVWGILLAGIGAIALAGIRFMMPNLSIISGIIYIVLGVMGLAIQITKYFDLQNFSDDLKASQESAGDIAYITMSYNAAWWLTMLGLCTIVIAGLIALLLEDQLTPQPQSATRSDFKLPPVPSSSNPNPHQNDDELPSWMNE